MRVDDPSTGSSSIKKSRQPSTHPGTQVIGSMLLGEHFKIFVVIVVCSCSQPSTFPFSDGSVVELLEGEEDEGEDAALNTRR
jgi:hypothetical protein